MLPLMKTGTLFFLLILRSNFDIQCKRSNESYSKTITFKSSAIWLASYCIYFNSKLKRIFEKQKYRCFFQLLEALTKNCGKIFHVQIAHKDFLKELKGVIGPKNNPPVAIQERVLSIIQVKNRNRISSILQSSFSLQTWALAFRNDPDLKAVEHYYQECKQHGLQFPPAEPENAIKTSVTPTVNFTSVIIICSLFFFFCIYQIQPSVERPLKSTRSMVRMIT